MTQFALALLTCISIGLFASKRLYKWGFVVGLLTQPFWLYDTYYGVDKWGMFIVSIVVSLMYIWGLMNHWRANEPTSN